MKMKVSIKIKIGKKEMKKLALWLIIIGIMAYSSAAY